MRWPSGLNATAMTSLVCPLSTSRSSPCGGVPDLDRRVSAARRKAPAVGAKRDAPDLVAEM